MRSEGQSETAALDEALRIGREGRLPVAIFHLKVSGKPRWGTCPLHSRGFMVEEGIMSEVSFYGVRPGARSGVWPSLLSEDDKDSCRSLPERTGSKQPEVPNSVLIAIRNVLNPTVNKLLD